MATGLFVCAAGTIAISPPRPDCWGGTGLKRSGSTEQFDNSSSGTASVKKTSLEKDPSFFIELLPCVEHVSRYCATLMQSWRATAFAAPSLAVWLGVQPD